MSESSPDHIAETVEIIAAFQKAHDAEASALQRAMETMTDRLGRPVLVALMFTGIGIWIVVTALIGSDEASEVSFAWLELSSTLSAFLVAMLILVTQRRQDRLSERRAQLTLELAIVADRKTAKLIALMEELRRDHPDLQDRDDDESRQMAQPTDPKSVLTAIDARAAPDKEPAPGRS